MRILVMTVALILGCRPSSRAVIPERLPKDAKVRALRAAELRSTLARLGVELDTEPTIRACSVGGEPNHCYRCDVAWLEQDLEPEQIHRLERAFARYPKRMITAANLKHVALCRAIRMGAFGAEGDPWRSPSGLAIADQERIMVSIEWRRLMGENAVERGVHHELFHLFDQRELGQNVNADAEWEDVNPPDFVYGVETDERPNGFVSHYATKNQLEDRASVFEHLMAEQAELCKLAEIDLVIAAKTAIVWNRVARVAGTELLPEGAPCKDWAGWKVTASGEASTRLRVPFRDR